MSGNLSELDRSMLEAVADMHEIPEGAYNIRRNGESAGRSTTEDIDIVTKTDKPGIDIYVKDGTQNKSIHIPVIITEAGVKECVYNDFHIGDDCDVLIVAGCGIHNCGDQDSQHDGIHTFHIGKRSHIKYIEKHYGEGDGKGGRLLNPVTTIYADEGAVVELEMVQIRGVDSTVRRTNAYLAAGARMQVLERLMTHGEQNAESYMDAFLNGEDSSLRIVSRSVAKDCSRQMFHPRAVGQARCHAHVQCDSIIMDNAQISSIPEIVAEHPEAAIIHEAAIGRINNDQLVKLQTFGMTEEEAEKVIIDCFLK